MEIVVDNFAGGGGVSTGIETAIGRPVNIAINHDPLAIAMHKTNHPNTEHYCESVWDIDPVKAVKGRPVALCWLSPDCKHFSKAKGGKPVEKNIRGLAWVAVRWAATVRPRVIILENVEEFKTWGPLLKNGKPDPDKKGRTFNAFVNALKRLGYAVEFRELRACDYGTPTIRKRFFLIARCDGQPVAWPKPTHGHPDSPEVKAGILKPWRIAAEIIDWSLPCPSIFGRKKPLAENTMRRIAKGIQKFVIDNPNPFIVRIGQTGFGKDGMQYPINQPLTTVTTKAEHLLITPFLAQYHSEKARSETRGQTVNRPILTIDTQPRYALISSHIIKLRGTNLGHPATEPLHTITAGGTHLGEVRAFLLKYYGTNIGQPCNEPIQTITTKHRFSLVTVHGQKYEIADIGMRMLEPHELFAAHGFPKTYIIDRDYEGNRFSKAVQVARCGNSVPPDLAEVLTRANLPDLCGISSYGEMAKQVNI